MQSYHDNLILQFDDDITGNAASNQLVTVFNAGTAVKPPLFDVFGSPIANPVTTDSKGNYSFSIADGTYDIVARQGTPDETSRDQFIIAVPGSGNIINDLSQAYEFATVAAFKASVIEFPDGKIIRLLDRNADFIEISGTGTGNDADIIDSDEVSQHLTLRDGFTLTNLGILLDIDQTSEIITLLNLYSGLVSVHIAAGGDVLAEWQEVSEAMPVNVMIDTSGVRTGWRSDIGGYTNKVGTGQLSRDSDQNDSMQEVTSGHHTTVLLMNTGAAGPGTSGPARLISHVFCNRYLNPAQSGRPGRQTHALLTLGENQTGDKWRYRLRRTAPWDAAGADYFEFWIEGVVTPAGGYVRSGNIIYKTTAGGTTGASQPVHTSGTVSDGGVDWTWISAGDVSIFIIDEDGNINSGANGNISALLGMTSLDKAAIIEFESGGISQDALLSLRPTDSNGDVVTVPHLRVNEDGTLRIVSSLENPLVKFHDDGFEIVRSMSKLSIEVNSNNTEEDATNINTIVLNNGSATDLERLLNVRNGQEVRLVGRAATTTVKHGLASGFILKGAADLLLGTNQTITFWQPPYTSSMIEV